MTSLEGYTLIVISPGFPSDESDTTCLPAQQLFLKELNRLFPGLKVVILALQYPFRKDRYQWFGNTVISLDGKSLPKFMRPVLWLGAYKELNRIHRHSSVLGVLSFWCHETALIGTFFSRRKRLKHKIWIMGQDARKNNILARWIRPNADTLVALSDFLADEFQKNHGIRPHHIIRTGIDQKMYSPVPVPKEIDLLGVGSLIPLKQYPILVEVVKGLVRFHPNLRAVLVGKGPEENRLRHLIDEANLGNHIILKGELPHPEIIQWMERSKILLHPSSYEGYGTVCLEALYAGCHVVSFISVEKKEIEQWHIVNSVADMINRCREILEPDIFRSKRILVNTMADSAKAMMQLFL